MSSDIDVKAPLTRVTTPDDVAKFATIITSSFTEDAVNHYLYLGLDARPDNPILQRNELRVQYWMKVIQPRLECGAILVQSHDWAAVALW